MSFIAKENEPFKVYKERAGVDFGHAEKPDFWNVSRMTL